METKHFFHYDERYLKFTNHTIEELYQLQSIIMNITKSNDMASDIRKLGKFEEKEIQTTLSMYCNEGKINRERVDELDGITIYRYFV